jgi:transcriptional regulator GlxA family with amidase domain
MTISIAILDYQDSLKSAVYGLDELFRMANRASREQGLLFNIEPHILTEGSLPVDHPSAREERVFDLVLIPPCDESEYYLSPNQGTLQWLQFQSKQGSILCSACAGTFILAKANLIENHTVTTHWGLAALFETTFPDASLCADKILINEGDIVTSGGMMSWLDLGLEIVAQHTQPSVMMQLGKMLVVDTGAREQRFYQQFSPIFTHGDEVILDVQKWVQQQLGAVLTIGLLAKKARLTERTFLRRFVRASGFKPTEYIQRLRVQKACEWLETSNHSFEWIANQVGYEDPGACRRIFTRIIGLTPKEFRNRFVS